MNQRHKTFSDAIKEASIKSLMDTKGINREEAEQEFNKPLPRYAQILINIVALALTVMLFSGVSYLGYIILDFLLVWISNEITLLFAMFVFLGIMGILLKGIKEFFNWV